MFNLQGSEIIVILLLALVVLGPDKLPDAIRRFSQTYNELKKMGSGFQSELKSALDEPMREMRETADMVRDAADPDKIAAQPAPDEQPAREEPVAETPPTTPPPGDPPPGDPPIADPPDDDAPRVNKVAAANSSGALAAGAASSDAAAADTRAHPDTQPDARSDTHSDTQSDTSPAGQPMFHSAAPRRVEANAADERSNGANDVNGAADSPSPDDGADDADAAPAVESSDETATA